jgi:hypothetical protein
VYDVNLLERVGFDIEPPTILHAIEWGKLYDEPCLDSRLLTLEILMTFDSFVRHRKSYFFRLLGRRYEFAYSQFSELVDFSSSCLPESEAMVNFDRLEFSDEISRKSPRIRFILISCMHISLVKSMIIQFLCCMRVVARCSGYLTRHLLCTLVNN